MPNSNLTSESVEIRAYPWQIRISAREEVNYWPRMNTDFHGLKSGFGEWLLLDDYEFGCNRFGEYHYIQAG